MISIIGLSSIKWSDAFLLSHDLPCDFLDSINITEGIRQSDKSIIYNNMTFHQDQYAKINYKLENGTARVAVDPYIRGCVCIDKPCIRLCCPYGTFVEGRNCRSHDAAKNFDAEILDANDKPENVILDDLFAYVDDRPCNKFFVAKEYHIKHVIFHINLNTQNCNDYNCITYLLFYLQTGVVVHENKSITHREYCLRLALNETTNKPKLGVLLCYKSADKLQARFNILPYGK